MLFKYRIRLEIEVEFDAPLLGVDTTKIRRGQTDAIAKAALAEMIKFKTTSYVGLDREIKEDNLRGTVKGEITLRTAAMHKRDQDAVKET
jgi:hypothetical protein